MAYTNMGLVEYCKGCLGLPYIYGTFGEKLTQSKLDWSYKKYPLYWSVSRYEKAKRDYLGKKVQDCTGLIEGYLMGSTPTTFAEYDGEVDRSADGWYRAATEKGKINTIPELPGVAVYMSGHIGVYIGGGYVIEARGFNYGVVKTKLKERPWTHWLMIKDIEYGEESTESEEYDMPQIKRGSKGQAVQIWQIIVGVEADGNFGSGTQSATKKWQKAHGLTADGIVGPKTWKLGLESVE